MPRGVMMPTPRVRPHTEKNLRPPTADAPPLRVPGGLDVARLTSAIGRGDERAFEELYRAWFDRVFGMARGLTRRDESFCLDVTQEVMLRTARSVPRLKDECELAGWMGRVVMSVAVDLLRRDSRRRNREVARGGVGVPQGESVRPEQRAQELAQLADALRGLSAEDQALVMQRVGAGCSLKEAGAGVGIGVQAAHGRVRRAMATLRGLMREVMP